MTTAADARAAIDLVAGAGLSLAIRGGAGPVADALLARLAARRGVMRLAASADVATLTGGTDPLATIAAGRPVRRPSLIERLDGRVLVVAGAERTPLALAALIGGWIDDGALGDGLVLLDEGEGDEALPAPLAERVAMVVDARSLTWRDVAFEAPEPGDAAVPGDDADRIALLVTVADRIGIASARASLSALRVAAASGDVALATRLALAPRARTLPVPPSEPEEADAPPPEPSPAAEGNAEVERLVEAVRTALPDGLIAGAATGRSGGTGGSIDARRGAAARGRLGRVRREVPGRGGRLDLVATLIAAAPMQRWRGREPGMAPRLRRDDLCVRRRVPRQRHATVIAVDASGSAAAARLGEVKGAVEQLLAHSYVRRDEVALIAFRREGAETLLPPTRSLARARRELAALPGGGATPLAAGIVAGLDQAARSRAGGRSTLLVVLTDGGANIARDGTADRAAAARDAEAAARQVAAVGIDALVIDASPRGAAPVRALAAAMRARYLALPRADDRALAAAIRTAR